MANVHDILITGEVPFHITDSPEMRDYLGMLNGPSLAVRISYTAHETRYLENDHGGRTAMYGFRIKGREAIWASTFSDMVKLMIKHGAIITEAKVRDREFYGLRNAVWNRLV